MLDATQTATTPDAEAIRDAVSARYGAVARQVSGTEDPSAIPLVDLTLAAHADADACCVPASSADSGCGCGTTDGDNKDAVAAFYNDADTAGLPKRSPTLPLAVATQPPWPS